MSTEPMERRSVLDMDREICRLRRAEKKYRAENDRLRAKLMAIGNRIGEPTSDWCETIAAEQPWLICLSHQQRTKKMFTDCL